MKSNFKFVTFIRNTECPFSDYFKAIVHIDDPALARDFFSMQGCYVYPDDLSSFLSPRQLARFKTFYNKPRHYDLFVLTINCFKAASF